MSTSSAERLPENKTRKLLLSSEEFRGFVDFVASGKIQSTEIDQYEVPLEAWLSVFEDPVFYIALRAVSLAASEGRLTHPTLIDAALRIYDRADVNSKADIIKQLKKCAPKGVENKKNWRSVLKKLVGKAMDEEPFMDVLGQWIKTLDSEYQEMVVEPLLSKIEAERDLLKQNVSRRTFLICLMGSEYRKEVKRAVMLLEPLLMEDVETLELLDTVIDKEVDKKLYFLSALRQIKNDMVFRNQYMLNLIGKSLNEKEGAVYELAKLLLSRAIKDREYREKITQSPRPSNELKNYIKHANVGTTRAPPEISHPHKTNRGKKRTPWPYKNLKGGLNANFR